MAALPYMQLYVADYLADTMHLDAEEHGAYLLILMNYWQTGKPVPVARLQKIARVSNDRWNSVETALKEFFNEEDGCWYHARVERDLEAVRQAQEQKSAAGKASAAARAASKTTKHQRESNDRSTTVENPLNENATNKDTDTDNSPSLRSGENARASRLPADWQLPDEWRDWAQTERPDLDVNQTADRFRDYWVAVPGAKGRKLDWAATWRNWVRNESGGKHENGSRTSQAGRSNSVIAAIARGALDSG